MASAQSCPANIGFEDGKFTNWVCYTGNINNDGTINLNAGGPPADTRQSILKNTSPQITDPYGGFPINCPNNSKYSIRLGNEAARNEAESISYTYTIPADQNNLALVYYYAVVLQNFNHLPFEQPAFRTNVKDITTDQLINCSAHTFTASANLAGFQTSTIDETVLYKDWSPVIIDLSGHAGHTIQINFTTNDCALGDHFGYAYLDFDEICDPNYDGIISGNKFCNGAQSVTLKAPAGLSSYAWYNGLNKKVGDKSTLTVAPQDAAQYSVVITPNQDLGCVYTFYTTLKKIDHAFNMLVKPAISGCKEYGIDLTQPSITYGSDLDLQYQYYIDPDGLNFVSDPKLVTRSGTYYIKGTNAGGCTDIRPIEVTLEDSPDLTVVQPAAACYPATVDLTTTASTTDPDVIINYYTDADTKIPVTNPHVISSSGKYYAKATSTRVPCISVQAINVIIGEVPKPDPLSKPFSECPPIDLSKAINAVSGLSYTYYTDAQGNQLVPDPFHITESGIYYYKAGTQYGCESEIIPVSINIIPPPVFTVTNPAPVIYPQSINLDDTHTSEAGITFTYWQDAAASIPLENYQNINQSGTYYIKADNNTSCPVIKPVKILVNAPPEANLAASNTFSPNGDGINDEFDPVVVGAAQVNYLKIFDRYGRKVFETRELLNHWKGTYNGKAEPAGTYYWVFNSYDTYYKKTIVRSGPVTIIR